MYTSLYNRDVYHNNNKKELNREKLSNFWIQRTCDTKSTIKVQPPLFP